MTVEEYPTAGSLAKLRNFQPKALPANANPLPVLQKLLSQTAQVLQAQVSLEEREHLRQR